MTVLSFQTVTSTSEPITIPKEYEIVDCWDVVRGGSLERMACQVFAGNEWHYCKNVCDVLTYDDLSTCLREIN